MNSNRSLYSDKIKELQLVGEYVERLHYIELDMEQHMDEGKLSAYVVTLLQNCIDNINKEYILASARQDIVTQNNECNDKGAI